jgi:hypothetical protein
MLSFPATIREAIEMDKSRFPANILTTKSKKVEHQDRY